MITQRLPLATAGPEILETSQVEFLNLPPTWLIVLVICPCLFALCRWLYRREGLSGRLRWLPSALRFASIALVLLFLFDPVRSHQRVRVERPLGVILLDDSASMRERDMGELALDSGLPAVATRSEVLAGVLADPIARFSERYETQLFAFGESLRAVVALDDLGASDGSTRLGDALAGLAAETRGRELAQVIVVSDGRVNAGRDVQAALSVLSARGVPVHTVGIGDPEIPRDVRIAGVTAPEVALAGDTVNLEVSVASRGYGGQPTVISVEDSGGRELARTDVTLTEGTGVAEQMVRLSFVPEIEGDLDLRVRAAVIPGERDPNNNEERRLLRVEPGHIRVLYVDGYPRYEYRFLVSLMLRASNLDVQCLLLSADPDFIQESTDGSPSLTRFPPELEDLLEYHVIIFGDVLPQSLGEHWEQHLEHIKRFVEAGGGFLMQAGTSWSPRDYADTPIADILPVLIGDTAAEMAHVSDASPTFRPVLQRPRDPHEIVSLHPDVDVNRMLWEQDLAPLTWYFPVSKARSTADVLLTHPVSRNSHGPHVLLATMYYPQGRTAFLGTDETWRWRLRFLETYREPFWRGLIRFLALNKLRRSDYRFDLSTDRSSYDIGDRMALTARVLDSSFEPLAAESVEVYVVRPDGSRATAPLEREGGSVFAGTLLASEPGPWKIWLEDAEADRGEIKSPRIVTVTMPSAETDDPVLDETLLRGLSARTGGRYVHLEDAVDLLDSLDDQPASRPLDEPEREELWAGWLQLLLLLALLAGEWIVRKKHNLV